MKIDFKPDVTFRGTAILKQADGLAYAYETTDASADADGAPNAYHPDDQGKNCAHDIHRGLDCLQNAGYPCSDWWQSVLVVNPDDTTKAFIQKDGPFAGFYVSMTSLRIDGRDQYDPATYVDATKVPYVVIPSGFEEVVSYSARQGDVGLATHLATGKTTPFIVADAGGGSDAKLGESSIALFCALGFPDANPRNGLGLPTDTIQYVIFANSRLEGSAKWPRTKEDIAEQVARLIVSTPGIEK